MADKGHFLKKAMLLLNKIQGLKMLLLSFNLAFVITSCSTDGKPQVVVPSFYYWKTSFNLSVADQDFLRKCNVQKIYFRFFDVVWDKHLNIPIPVSALKFQSPLNDYFSYVPTIFITNQAMTNIPDTIIRDVGNRICDKVRQMITNIKNKNIDEIQLDCDWSESTKEKYFQLIQTIKNNFKNQNFIVSATIRLHQVKYYKKTGVPPVNRGMLMFYNMGKLNDTATINSIFEMKTAKKYLVNFDTYPLKLDIALPLFSWGVVFRNNKVIRLITELDQEEILHDTNFVETKVNHFVANQNSWFKAFDINSGDMIRLEQVNVDTTLRAAELIQSKLRKEDTLNVAIFHFNHKIKNNYDEKQIKSIYSIFN